MGKTKRGKGTKLMVITDAHGLPLAVHTASASPHEVTLVEATLDEAVTVGRPRRLMSRMKASGLLVDVPTVNAEVGKWLRDVANRRVHPLTRHAPHTLYENVEKALLQPLPKYRPRIDPAWPAMRSVSAQVNPLQHPLSVYQQILTEVGV